jgi:hypothetical protein
MAPATPQQFSIMNSSDLGDALHRAARVAVPLVALAITVGQLVFWLGGQFRLALERRNDQLARWWVGLLGLRALQCPPSPLSRPSEPSYPSDPLPKPAAQRKPRTKKPAAAKPAAASPRPARRARRQKSAMATA